MPTSLEYYINYIILLFILECTYFIDDVLSVLYSETEDKAKLHNMGKQNITVSVTIVQILLHRAVLTRKLSTISVKRFQ